MRVVLLQDINGLGKKGDVREVADGYGRNFLLRKNLAEAATPQILNRIASEKASGEKHEEKEKTQAAVLKEKLENTDLSFKVKIGEKGRAFGSVTPTKILAELKRKGINLDKELLPRESIKTLGSRKILVKLPYGLEANLKIFIEAEK